MKLITVDLIVVNALISLIECSIWSFPWWILTKLIYMISFVEVSCLYDVVSRTVAYKGSFPSTSIVFCFPNKNDTLDWSSLNKHPLINSFLLKPLYQILRYFLHLILYDINSVLILVIDLREHNWITVIFIDAFSDGM